MLIANKKTRSKKKPYIRPVRRSGRINNQRGGNDEGRNFVTFTNSKIGHTRTLGIETGLVREYNERAQVVASNSVGGSTWSVYRPPKNVDFVDPNGIRVFLKCQFTVPNDAGTRQLYAHEGFFAPICGIGINCFREITLQLDGIDVGGTRTTEPNIQNYLRSLFQEGPYPSDLFHNQSTRESYLEGIVYSTPGSHNTMAVDTQYGHRLTVTSHHNYPPTEEPRSGLRIAANGNALSGTAYIDAGAVMRREYVDRFQRANRAVEYISTLRLGPFSNINISHNYMAGTSSFNYEFETHPSSGYVINAHTTTFAIDGRDVASNTIQFGINDMHILFPIRTLSEKMTEYLNSALHTQGKRQMYVGIDTRTGSEVMLPGIRVWTSQPITNYAQPQKVCIAMQPNIAAQNMQEYARDPFEFNPIAAIEQIRVLVNGKDCIEPIQNNTQAWRQTVTCMGYEKGAPIGCEQFPAGYFCIWVDTSTDKLENTYMLQKSANGSVQIEIKFATVPVDHQRIYTMAQRTNVWEFAALKGLETVVGPL